MNAAAHPGEPPAGRRRIGLYGGSFDPVHQAHLALAQLALRTLQLDELRWIPAGQPWQKRRELAPPQHRAGQIEALLAELAEPRFVLERCELDRPGPSYTLETVRALQAANPPAEWFLILGADQVCNLHTWFGWEELLQRVTLAVAAREGCEPEPAAQLQARAPRIELLRLPQMPLSSTRIRALLAAGTDPQALAPALVAPAVAGYIARHRLYGATTSDRSS
ncbi:MAG: nicotinate (nicotinamide) nucleotide adenylyltransferase [Pseudomonadota bacterium]